MLIPMVCIILKFSFDLILKRVATMVMRQRQITFMHALVIMIKMQMMANRVNMRQSGYGMKDTQLAGMEITGFTTILR